MYSGNVLSKSMTCQWQEFNFFFLLHVTISNNEKGGGSNRTRRKGDWTWIDCGWANEKAVWLRLWCDKLRLCKTKRVCEVVRIIGISRFRIWTSNTLGSIIFDRLFCIMPQYHLLKGLLKTIIAQRLHLQHQRTLPPNQALGLDDK